MSEIKLDDPLLRFFHALLEEEEKCVISMIFKNYDDTRIIEELINYKKEAKTDD